MHNQNRAVLTYYKVGVSMLISKNCFVVNFIYNVKCHSFSIHVSSSKHRRCLTLEFCLISISYFMWSFFIFLLLNLEHLLLILSYSHQAYYPQTNHIYYKNVHFLLILLISLCWQTRHASSAHLDLSSYGTDSWRRWTLQGDFWCSG